MKRLLCVLLILCVVPAIASALTDVEDFDIYASVFGMKEIKDCENETIRSKTVYVVDNGYVGFDYSSGQLDSISVFGDGDHFLLYSVAAFCVLEGNSDHLFDNCGELFKKYLICRVNEEMTTGMTEGGLFYLIQPYDGKYMILVQR